MHECSVRPQSIIRKSSYRKHRERLTDIHHNMTSKDFYLNVHPRPEDKKGFLRNKQKDEAIRHENRVLKHKIGSINGRTHNELEQPQFVNRTEQVRNGLVRYDKQEDGKLDVLSDFSDGQPMRCIVPGKSRAQSFMPHSKPNPKLQATSYHTSKPQGRGRKTRPQSFHRTNNSERAACLNNCKSIQNQKYFHLPEQNQQRKVINNKTIILSSTQSCLFEFSLIGERLLIAAHIIGTNKYCLTQLLTEKRTNIIMKQCQGNYEELYQKITLEENNKRYHAIKIRTKEMEREATEKERVSEKERNRRKVSIQNDFIKRNYYGTLRKEEVEHSLDSKQKQPCLAYQKISEIVERLTAPKRYLIKDLPTPPPLPLPPKQQTNAKPSSPINIHLDSNSQSQQRKRQRQNLAKNVVEQRSQAKVQGVHHLAQTERVRLKRTESVVYDRQGTSRENDDGNKNADPSILNSKIMKRTELNARKEADEKKKEAEEQEEEEQEQEVDYLDGDLDQYQEQFENPSGVEVAVPQNVVQDFQKDPSKGSSKSKQSKKEKAVPLVKDQSSEQENIYQEEYQNNEYAQDLDEGSPLDRKEEGGSKAGKTINNKSSVLPDANIEEEYAQEQQN